LPGAPFGGLAFFDPQHNADRAGDEGAPPATLTKEVLQAAKLRELRSLSQGGPSMYLWAFHPIFDTHDSVVGAEILARCCNGSDSAPFEDVAALADPKATEEVRKVYVAWKATEIVDWTLKELKAYPILQQLRGVSTNVRPLDMAPSNALFKEVAKRLAALEHADRELLKRMVVVEVTEDQEAPEHLQESLQAWANLGFRLSYDDAVGNLAHEALGQEGKTYHTIEALTPFLWHFGNLKVDIDWAGYALFLSHPAYSRNPKLKAEVLRHARDEDQMYYLRKGALVNTNVSHSALLAEFADWALRMIALRKTICIELSVRQDDENNAFTASKLKKLGLDIFGEHQVSFSFQGGPVFDRAFQPGVLAARLNLFE
jgi:hypothetical protein